MGHRTWSLFLLVGCAGAPEVDDSAVPDDSGLPADLHGTPPADALPVPEFVAYDHDGAQRGQADLRGHPTALWFHPGADDELTREIGAAFAELVAAFAGHDVHVIAVGFDPVEANAAWASDASVPYDLWTDPNKELASYYGAIAGPWSASPDRITALLDDRGLLVLEYRLDTASPTHPARVLEDVEAMWGSR